jgi:hypothetical protein
MHIPEYVHTDAWKGIYIYVFFFSYSIVFTCSCMRVNIYMIYVPEDVRTDAA